MLLNFQYHQTIQPNQNIPVVLIHGLFGSLTNLGMIGRALNGTHDIVLIDIRNHGHSPHSNEMSYTAMAQDVVETLDHLKIKQFSVIGHSMGGKLAMKLTEVALERLQQLVILDMAPFAYHENHHDQVFKALFAVKNAQIESRKEATEIMRSLLNEEMVIQFLLKSFHQGQWLFNVNALFKHYQEIIDWQEIPVWHKPTLFIRGGHSPYMSQNIHLQAIERQFSQARLETVENAGHWLHAEKTSEVNTLISEFLI
ncbi:alpha/beta fold hydrolase [Acinetobacter silvestris]|uniref:Alpha/beta hydrolase n=1 Tax=Acinetobacter silvestris TaxID=1977882 RepID=A0A1Y3CF83_9GAMM|nr:alpha/beta fold hydrolase [Acinetobacter silvestris]OTG65006.1 alpha/beta hydrolase [Acinetobacter silvestris]